LEIYHQRRGTALLVTMRGELDLLTAPVFRTQVDQELETYERLSNLILDLSKVDFIDSSGLGAILGRYKRIRERGGKLLLVNAQPQVQKILELSGLDKIMPLFPDAERALEHL
jgi:stage II sporulation protein AA (anti-sigma F factor antagonist)